MLWKVRYQSQQDLIWSVELTEVEGVIKLIGMGFGTIYDSSKSKTCGYSVNDKNAESIGNPMLETVIRLLEKPDYLEFSNKFPKMFGREFLEEAVGNLKPMGRMKSIEYLTRLNKPSHFILAWKVQYEKEDEDLLWELHFSDRDGEVNLIGLGFSR